MRSPLPFWPSRARKPPLSMLGIDIGARATKAVHLQRTGQSFCLRGYAVVSSPVWEKGFDSDLLSQHLAAIKSLFAGKIRSAALSLGVADALVRVLELPRMPVPEMRAALKHNAKTYLQQELPSHVFDAQPFATFSGPAGETTVKTSQAQKQRVLVAGADQQRIAEMVDASRRAGLEPEHIIPSLVAPINAFERALPEVYLNSVAALVDLGHNQTSVCILNRGELALHRVVPIGGDHLTAAASQTLGVSYAEAEGLKLGLPVEIHHALKPELNALSREIRASIDYFEHQHDKTVNGVFVSGAAARSEFMLESFQSELMIRCQSWDPTKLLEKELAPVHNAKLDQVCCQLPVALGAALGAL